MITIVQGDVNIGWLLDQQADPNNPIDTPEQVPTESGPDQIPVCDDGNFFSGNCETNNWCEFNHCEAGVSNPSDPDFPVELVIDLGKLYDVYQVTILDGHGGPPMNNNDIEAEFKLYGSTDFCSSDWADIMTTDLNETGVWKNINNLSSGLVRHLRITINKQGAGIGELIFFYTQMYDPPFGDCSSDVPFEIPDITMSGFMGINAFAYSDIEALKAVGFVREYQHWKWLDTPEHPGGPYPLITSLDVCDDIHSPGCTHFSWDDSRNSSITQFYINAKAAGLEVVPVLVGNTEHFGFDMNANGNSEYKPIWDNPTDGIPLSSTEPASYGLHADLMYQFAARYGESVFADAKLKSQDKKSGLWSMTNINYIENWNEQDKTWFGPMAEFSPEEYAAMSSADYDGHQEQITMLSNNGTPIPLGIRSVENGENGIKLVMGGLAELNVNYVKLMKSWFECNRSDCLFPFDVLNFHHYSNALDGQGFTGIPAPSGAVAQSPEKDNLREKLKPIVAYRDMQLPGRELWLSEFGYDTHDVPIEDRSGQSVPEDINGLDMQEIQGQWIVRSFLEIVAAGFDRAQLFWLEDQNIRNTFFHSGLLKANGQPKKSWFYVYTMKNILGDTKFHEDLSPEYDGDENEVRVYSFLNHSTGEEILVVWSPTEENAQFNYTLDLGSNVQAATLVKMKPFDVNGTNMPLTIDTDQNGSSLVDIEVSERPVFIIKGTNLIEPSKPCPTNLQVSNPTCSTVRLTFSVPADDVLSYQVWYMDEYVAASDFNINDAQLLIEHIDPGDFQAGQIRTIGLAGLEPNTSYSFAVIAEYDPNGPDCEPGENPPCVDEVADNEYSEICEVARICTIEESNGCYIPLKLDKSDPGFTLFDEPNSDGCNDSNFDLFCGTCTNPDGGENPTTLWQGGLEGEVILSLGDDYHIEAILAFDDVGEGNFSISYRSEDSGPFLPLGTYYTSAYQRWVVIPNVSASGASIKYLKFNKEVNGNIAEIRLIGGAACETECEAWNPGSCSCAMIFGCTDPNACNYNPNATCSDGSCNSSGIEVNISFNWFQEIVSASASGGTGNYTYLWEITNGEESIPYEGSSLRVLCDTWTYTVTVNDCQSGCIGTASRQIGWKACSGKPPIGGFRIYPNPASNEFTFTYELPIEENVALELFNNMGQLIKSIPLDSRRTRVNISTNTFSPGIYYPVIGMIENPRL